MEYEFRKDFITQKPTANFSFDHEAFGPWLEVEVSKDIDKLTKVFDFIESAQKGSGQNSNKVLVGQEYSLFLFEDEIEVKANIEDIELELPDVLLNDVDDFEQNTQACCSIDDFLIMLESWQEFLTS